MFYEFLMMDFWGEDLAADCYSTEMNGSEWACGTVSTTHVDMRLLIARPSILSVCADI